MANGLIYEQLEKGELRTPQGKKVGSFTTNTLPRQVGKPKKRKGQKTSIPQSTYAKGMKRVKDQRDKALIQADEDRHMSKYPLSVRSAKGTKYSVGPKLTKMQKKVYKKKSTEGYKKVDAYNKFIKADKKFR